MKKSTLVLFDEINCQLLNFDRDILKFFNKKFTYYVPSARFSPKYQLGIWDGSISFFNMNGETYINLLPKIIPNLVELKINFEIVDNRDKSKLIEFPKIDKDYFGDFIHPEYGVPLELRPYQVIAINTLLKTNVGILLASTGAGKTNITAAICDLFNKVDIKSLVIVPSSSLVNQTKKALSNCNLDVGELSGKLKDPNHMTVISTWQTLQNIKPIIRDFQMVLVDETHTAKGQVLNKLLSEFGNHMRYRYGLTGTLPKDEIDMINIQNVLGDVQYSIKARDLIDQGYLADLHIEIYEMIENFKDQYDNYIKTANKKISYASFKKSYFPDYQAEKSYLKKCEKRIEHIGNLLIQRSKIGNLFVLIDGIQFGKKLHKYISENIDIEHVYFISGKDDVKAREEVYNLFKDNDNIICIATVNVAGTGLDIARIYQLVLIDLGKSFIRIIQSIGRGLRKAKDKDFIEIVDICSDLKYSKRHLTERLKYYKEAEYPHSKKKIEY